MDRGLREAKRGLEAAGYLILDVERRSRHRFVVILDATTGRRASVYVGCMSGRNTNLSTWARLAREALARHPQGSAA